mgnify:CR=1 FL=1
MTREEAQRLLERQCATPDCWHRPASGYIYCVCCLHGVCAVIHVEDRQPYIEARNILSAAVTVC